MAHEGCVGGRGSGPQAEDRREAHGSALQVPGAAGGTFLEFLVEVIGFLNSFFVLNVLKDNNHLLKS